MALYPSLKPLPVPKPLNVRQAKPQPGAVRQSVYERRKFQEVFKPRPK